MASAMLFAGVLAVITAIMGGQQRAFEAQRRITAALVAEELMGEIATLDQVALSMYPTSQMVGPYTAQTIKLQTGEDLPGGVRVRGTRVHVMITQPGVLLAEAELFIPEPQS